MPSTNPQRSVRARPLPQRGGAAYADVVVVGAGQAGSEVVQQLRHGGMDGSIVLLGEEKQLPYERPPLSKAVLVRGLTEDRLRLRELKVYEDLDIQIARGRRATALDPGEHVVTTGDGAAIRYGRCVLAMGARAVPSPWPTRGRIHAVRTLADAVRLRTAVLEGARTFMVVGGGFLGLEIASSLNELGAEVRLVEASGRLLPGKASSFTADWLASRQRARGVELHLSCLVSELVESPDHVSVRLVDGARFTVDQVVYAAGAVPNSELAAEAGAECGRGVYVDAAGRTSLPDVYAAGDVASLRTRGGREARIESVSNAMDQARAVADALLGNPTVTSTVPTFWTEQMGVRLQMAGWVPPEPETHDVVEHDEDTVLVERYLSGALVAVETVGRPVDYLRALRTVTDMRFRA